jgi:ANTAR domain
MRLPSEACSRPSSMELRMSCRARSTPRSNVSPQYQNLQGAFGRRATIERARGILMSRHSINAEAAFELLRDHSQHNGRKLIDVAEAVVESHLLLAPQAMHEDSSTRRDGHLPQSRNGPNANLEREERGA